MFFFQLGKPSFKKENLFDILDIVNSAIEKLMMILVLAWSLDDYLLEYSINLNVFFLFILYTFGSF